MSTSKHIDALCLVVCIFTLLLTGLFMNGKALGITPIVDGDAGDDQFTANDLNADWDSAGATQITLTGDGGSVKGSGAYISDGDVHILYAGKYVLSGELTNGTVIIEADNDDKIWLLLNGVSLHCDDSAAILIEQAEKVFITLAEGTESFVSSGAAYTEDAVSAGIDGTIYSRDDLTINGSGSLRVTAEYQHAIVGNDDFVITGGTIEINAVHDGIHANDSARFTDALITINAGDDGITVSNDDATGYVYMASGIISIPSCYEGIEAVDITIAGGTLDIRPTDDGINANGQGTNSMIQITGGDITIINETGRDADGLDSNSNIHISGGNLFISVNSNGGNTAIDYGSESGGVCEISGGTLVAAGSSTMAEGFDSSSAQGFIMYTTSTVSAGTAISLKNSGGNLLLSEEIPCSFSSLAVSAPELQVGETCTLSIGETEEELTVDNSSNSWGFGMTGMFGGGMRGGWGGRQERPFENPMDAGSDQTQNIPETSDRGAGQNRMSEQYDFQPPENADAEWQAPATDDGNQGNLEPPQQSTSDSGELLQPDMDMNRPQGMPDNGNAGGENPQPFDRQDNNRPGGEGMWGSPGNNPGEWNFPENTQFGNSETVSYDSISMLIASIAVLGIGLAFAFLFKRK